MAFRALIAAAAVLVMLRLPMTWSRVAFVFVWVLVPTENNVWSLVGTMMIAALLFERLDKPWAQWLGTFPLAVFALEKMTGFGLCGVIVACLAGASFLERDRKGAARWIVSWILWVALLWIACGQSLANFPMWLARSFEMSGAYSEAMATDGPEELVRAGVWSLGLAALLLGLYLTFSARRARELGWALAWTFGMFVVYKAGFVRAFDHTSIFFFAVPPIAYLIADPVGASAAGRRALAIARHALAGFAYLVGLTMFGDHGPLAMHWRVAQMSLQTSFAVHYAQHPAMLREDCLRELALNAPKFALPRAREYVGTGTVDVFPAQHGVAVLNDMRFSVRPVLHGYATFTPALADLNARFLESERAPRFALLELLSMDWRPSLMDDAEAVQVLARDYVPVFIEGDDLLLERRPDAPHPRRVGRVTQIEREIGFGDSVDFRNVTGLCHVLSLDVTYTLAGRGKTWIDKPPPIFALVKLTDGRLLRARIVPGMIRGGVIFDPWIETNEEWLRWRNGEPMAQLDAITLEVPTAPWVYEPTVRLRYDLAPDLAPERKAAAHVAGPGPLVNSQPTRIEPAGGSKLLTFADVSAWGVATPSKIVFEVPAGKLHLQCFHGLMPRCYTVRHSDGAGFSAVLVRDGVDVETVYHRNIDPRNVEADRGHVHVDVDFDVTRPCELELRTDGGPAGDALDDWAYWGGVRISRVVEASPIDSPIGNPIGGAIGGSTAPR